MENHHLSQVNQFKHGPFSIAKLFNFWRVNSSPGISIFVAYVPMKSHEICLKNADCKLLNPMKIPWNSNHKTLEFAIFINFLGNPSRNWRFSISDDFRRLSRSPSTPHPPPRPGKARPVPLEDVSRSPRRGAVWQIIEPRFRKHGTLHGRKYGKIESRKCGF